MQKLFPLLISFLSVASLFGCAVISVPEVIRSADLMPRQHTVAGPAETLFPLQIEQFQDSRPNKNVVGQNHEGTAVSNVVVDREMASILEDVVVREFAAKGIPAGNSIFTLKGSVQRVSIGNLPFTKAGNSIMGEISVELTIYHGRKNTLVWTRSFAGKSMGNEYRAVFAQAMKELAEGIRKDESLLKLKDRYDSAVAEQPPATRTASAQRKTSKRSASIAKSDVDDLSGLRSESRQSAYAIVIGIEEYRQKLPKADFALNDAKLVGEYLSKAMGYPEENIVTLTNQHATKSDFEKYFEKWLSNHTDKDSTVFIYYSGHGAPNPKSGDAYLVPYDGDPAFIEQTGYSLKRLYESLNKLPAKEIIVALDSCFSGAGGRSVISKGSRPLVMNLQGNTALSSNMTVLTASSGDQISSTYDEKRHGLFTYFLLNGIKNKGLVRPDGSLKMDDLLSYIKPQVERIARKQYNNEQTPQLIRAANK